MIITSIIIYSIVNFCFWVGLKFHQGKDPGK